MEINLLAKSSSQTELSYQVNFNFLDGVLFINCSCPAGNFGQLCKHKIAFIEGDHDMLYDESQHQLLKDVIGLINASPFKEEYLRFRSREMEIKKIQQKLKDELKDLKKDLALKMQKGIRM